MKLRTALLLVGLLLGLSALGPIIPDSNAQTVTILYSFGSSANDGANPYAGLVQGSDGNLYGTTDGGGSTNCYFGCGTVFRISPAGTYTNLYSFAGPPNDGANPLGGLVQGSDGNFYGTTSNAFGTVFRISPGGVYTNLYFFGGSPNDGKYPKATLTQGSDGNFYGTTGGGGTHNIGTVFRISPDGNYTNLYSFVDQPPFPQRGGNPFGRLVQDNDGDFYGTTSGGNGQGTVFRVSPDGDYTNLYFFPSGDYATGSLAPGNDGNLYGTTLNGGMNGGGMVFRISPSGNFRNLYNFVGPPNDGGRPWAGLVQGSDGNLYGTTLDPSSLFRISPDGTYTNFGGAPGSLIAGLIQCSDGNFYGTSNDGGTNGAGTVYKLTIPLNPPANQISAIQFFNLFDSVGVGALIPSVAGETYQLQYTDSLSPTNWINTGDPAASIGGPMILIDLTGALPQQRFYRAVITP